MAKLVHAYLALWESRDYRMTCYRLSLGARETEEQESDPILRIPYADEAEDRALWCEPKPLESCLKGSPIGLAVELRGEWALPLMNGESGLHMFGSANAKAVEVVVLGEALKKYQPPEDLHLRKLPVGVPKRRIYNHVRGMVEDPRLDLRKPWNGKALSGIVPDMVAAELRRIAKEACS